MPGIFTTWRGGGDPRLGCSDHMLDFLSPVGSLDSSGETEPESDISPLSFGQTFNVMKEKHQVSVFAWGVKCLKKVASPAPQLPWPHSCLRPRLQATTPQGPRLLSVPSNTPGWNAQLSQEGMFSWLTTHSLRLRAGSLQCPKAPSACSVRPCT